jgi:hypothetical protein
MLAGLVLALAVQLSAGQPQELAPGARYDPNIPTLVDVAGHDFGEEISSPEEIAAYLRALATAAPDRTRLVEYARSWQGRPLHVLVIAAPQRIARLEQVKADLRRLSDPRAHEPGEADRLIKQLPVVTLLMHAVHGNEISSSDAALAEAYHLLAAQNDEAVETILRESIVLIDPLQNPDGRARFVFQTRQGRAATPDADPVAAERDEPWPGGRSNHYLFDMNRDWFALSQPETRGRVNLYLEWFPHVAVDLHEMSGDSTYYFAPPAEPANPYITKQQHAWFDEFGRANAARFDERGFPYFIREVFDSFYPGYGESWPIFQGAIGMTYEQASARGLVYRRRDDQLLSYRDGVVAHFTAALTTATTAARNRERLLRDFVEYRRSAVQEGERGKMRAYVLVRGSDPTRADRLARLLAAQGVEVHRAEDEIRHGTRTLPAGSYIVPLAQPSGRLVRNLLERQIPLEEPFVKAQQERRRRRLPDQIYDVTGWSLPLLQNVEAIAMDRAVTSRSTRVDATAGNAPEALRPARVGYLIPWGSGAAGAVVEALQTGLRVHSAGEPFTHGGRRYPLGTALLRTADNPPDLPDRLAPIVARHRIEAVPVQTGWVEQGISLGSNRMIALKAPRVILAWDAPTHSLSAGWARYVLEQRFGQPVTAIRVASLGRADLGRYDVVVLPSGNYADALNEAVMTRLKDWVRTGGTLITIGEASRWAAREQTGLLETRTELRDGRPEADPTEEDRKKDREAPKQPVDFEEAIRPARERPDPVPGAILSVQLSPDHWLAAGHDEEVHVVVQGQRVFTPITLDKGRNVGAYAAKDRLVSSGLVWEEAQQQRANKAYLIHQPMGQGHLIAFAEDPNFRAFTEATQLLFINAVLMGPAY